DASWEVMRGRRSVRLVQLVRRKKGEKPARAPEAEVSVQGIDDPLFQKLRALRKEIASERQVSADLLFNDATLRGLATVKPTTPERMRGITGVGDVKLRDFGPRFLAVIAEHLGVSAPPGRAEPAADLFGVPPAPSGSHQTQLFELFE